MFLAQVRFPYRTGLPADWAINTFAFDIDIDEPTIGTSIAVLNGHLENFYMTDTPSGQKVADYMSGFIDPGADKCEIRWFIMDGVSDGSGDDFDPYPVVHTFTGPDTSASSLSLPLEVAVCCTTIGASLEPVRRRRGRIYVGPCNTDLLANTTGDRPSVATLAITTIAEAAARLANQTTTDENPWSVWSRAGAVLSPVVGGWVDNEFDTQRRRGAEATARTEWSSIIP